jgi:hypothetical protein
VESLVDGDPPLDKEDYESVLIHPSPMAEANVRAGEKLMVGDRAMLLYVALDAAPESVEAQAVVRALRARGHVGDGSLLVGGQTANDVDTTEFIRSRTPHVVIFIVGMTFVILFVLLGSVVLPLKAVLMNALSVTGSFGALVWVFQDGHLGIAAPRPVEASVPVLLFCVLFGLSMDYEVLMMSRMKEVFDRTGDNEQAVAEGLEKTAGLITSAAAIMVVVFSAFALAGVVVVRAVGFGMALAVALDATLVRVLLAVETWSAWQAPGDGTARVVAACVGTDLRTWTREANPLALERLEATVGATLIRLELPGALRVTREVQAGVVTEQWLVGEGNEPTTARTFLGFTSPGGEAHVVGCFVLCAPSSPACDETMRVAAPTTAFVPPPQPNAALRALLLAVHHSRATALGAIALFVVAGVVAVWQRPRPRRK